MIDIIRGDWRFFWSDNLPDFATVPSSWDSSLNTGLGIPSVNTMWITSYLNLTAFFSKLFHLDWFVAGIMFWIIPILVISLASSFLLFRYSFPEKKNGAYLASLIYVVNSYFLLMFGGGQLGVAFAYSFIPLVLLFFLRTYQKTTTKQSLLLSLVLAAQMLFDTRISLLTFAACLLFSLMTVSISWKRIAYCFILPIIVSIFLHSFWILPLLLYPSPLLPEGNTNIKAAEFLSFAKFENTISLLHPNWPENLFGKVYFMRAEFLLVPIVAFAGLFYINKKKKFQRDLVLFFLILALLAAFFAKGTNEPFGWIYSYLFGNLPGFSLFRDSTKFYSLIAVSFAMLIPFTLMELSSQLKNWLKKIKRTKKYSKYAPHIVCFIFVILWLTLLRGAIVQNHSLFRVKKIPTEYIQLHGYLADQDEWFRTLWVPQGQRYGFFSHQNPTIGRAEIFKESSASAILKELPKTKEQLELIGVKYIIVPFDSESEIFVNDHKYNDDAYKKTVASIEKIDWLKKEKEFGKVVIYKTPKYQHRFFFKASESGTLTFDYKSQTSYVLHLTNVKKNSQLIFSETFSPYWKIVYNGKSVNAKNFKGLNSFTLSQSGTYTVELVYEPQKAVLAGFAITFFVLSCMIVYLIRDKIKR